MDLYLQDDNAVTNLFGEDVQVPRAIPFYLKELKIKSLHHTAAVIAIYVRKLHYGTLSHLITKAPFEEIELVPQPDKVTKRCLTKEYNCTTSYARTAAPSSYGTQRLTSVND